MREQVSKDLIYTYIVKTIYIVWATTARQIQMMSQAEIVSMHLNLEKKEKQTNKQILWSKEKKMLANKKSQTLISCLPKQNRSS